MDGFDEHLRRLREVTREAASTEDGARALRLLAEAAVTLTGASAAVLEVSGVETTGRLVAGTAAAGEPVLETPLPSAGGHAGRLLIHADGAVFSAADRELAGTLAGLAGIVVEAARLRERVAARERWLDAVHDITAALIEGERLVDVLRSTTMHTRTLVGADLATVAVPQDLETLVLQAADGAKSDVLEGVVFPHAGSISGEVIDTGEPLRIDDVGKDPRAAQPVVRLEVFGPALFIPLAAHGRRFGTLLVARSRGERPFDDGDLDIVVRVASHASLAVEYARSLEQLQRLGLLEERERIGRELHESVIQRVFDTGLSIEDVAMRLEADAPELARRLTGAVDQLDRVARDIRTAVFPSAGAEA